MGRPVEYVESVRADRDGTIYKAHGNPTSRVTQDRVYKSLGGFDGDRELAEECLSIWQEQGWTGGPSSPASFFRKQMQEEKPYQNRGYINREIGPFFHGGWIEQNKDGHIIQSVNHYDINSAYLYAGSGKKLPSKLRRYEPGDSEYVVLGEVKSTDFEIPRIYRCVEDPKYAILDHQDVEFFGIDFEPVVGCSWPRRDVDLTEYLYRWAGELPPKAWKRLTQSYWGCFAMRSPLEVEHRKDGELKNEWVQFNRLKNLPWAVLIVHEVIRTVYRQIVARDWISIFVDSILTTDEIETGDQPGEWSLDGRFEQGIYLQAPGIWTPLPRRRNQPVNEWYKHSGIPSLEAS